MISFQFCLRCGARLRYQKWGAWGHGPLAPLKPPLIKREYPSNYSSHLKEKDPMFATIAYIL